MGDTVLVADDDVDIARYVELNLSLEGFNVEVAHDGQSAIARALDLRPDAIVLDVMMPGVDGIEVCRNLREDVRTAHTAIVMLTARSLSADTVLGLTAGADDYIAKPFDPPELVARVRSAIRRARQLRDVSPLTGLPGNTDIVRRLERLVGEEPQCFAALHIDIDRFKSFNDRYGFHRGDQAIKATAELLAVVLDGFPTPVHFLGHVGGDDFVILTDPGALVPLAEAIVARFDEMAPSLYDPDDAERGFVEVEDRRNQRHRVPLMSVSIGAATTEHRHFDTVAQVSAVATEMKMVAKAADGSSYRVDRRQQ